MFCRTNISEFDYVVLAQTLLGVYALYHHSENPKSLNVANGAANQDCRPLSAFSLMPMM